MRVSQREFSSTLFQPQLQRGTLEKYELVVGKAKHVQAHYKEVTIPLEETISPFTKINIVVRAFDDGLAFRYQIPLQQNSSTYTLLEENTTFKLSGDPTVHSTDSG